MFNWRHLFRQCHQQYFKRRITRKGRRFSLTFWTFSIANIFTNLFIDVNQSGFATLDARFW